MRIGDNFDAIFGDGIDGETIRDVQALYRAESEAALARNAAYRSRVGYENYQPHGFIDGLGAVTFAPTQRDFFWAQRFHNATFDDPDFRRWFTRTPDGEYARVNSESMTIQVGYTGPSRRRYFKSYGEG